MEVTVKKVALKQVPVRILRPGPKGKFAIIFIANARFAAERNVPSIFIQRDVLQYIERIRSFGWIDEVAPIFIKAQQLISRNRRRCLLTPLRITPRGLSLN